MSIATHIYADTEIPAPGTFSIDPAHSQVGFTVRHAMVSKTRGRFGQFDATVVVGDEPADSSVTVTIQAASIDTGEAGRDAHLTSPDFLDVENFPTLTFASTAVRDFDGGEFELEGTLTIKDVTRPVVLKAEFAGVAKDPWGMERIGFSATTDLDREDFGLTWNQVLETGGVLVGKKVKIEIDAEFVRNA